MKIRDGYILKQMGKKHIVIYAGSDGNGLQGVISMNAVGAFLWKKLEIGCTKQELLDAVTAQYEVSAETAEKDIDSTLLLLGRENVLED